MNSETRAAFLFVLTYLKKYWLHLVAGLIAIILASFLQAIVPIIVGSAIDFIRGVQTGSTVAMPDPLQPLLRLFEAPALVLISFGAVIAIISLGLAVCRIYSRILLANVSRHAEYDMLNDYLRHLQKMSQRFFQTNKTGDLMARATNDITAIRRMTSGGVIQAMSTLVTLIFGLIFMLRLSPLLTLVALSPLPFVVIIVYSRVGKIHSLFDKIQDQFSTLTSRAQENFSGIRVIKSYVREFFEIEAFKNENREYIKRHLHLAKIEAFLHASLEFLLGLGVIAVLWVGVLQIMAGKATLGELVAFLSYVGMLAWPMIAIGILLNTWQQGLTAAQRVQKILNEPVDIRDKTATNRAISKIFGRIEFKNVSFKYPDAELMVLDNISLTIAQGETLAIVGPTGSGKSTFVHLLPRLIEPTSGTILIDGHDIKTIPLQLLRDSIGFVQQESFLFSDSIAENISFGLLQAPVDKISDAAEISQLKLDIDQFPDGLETIIGERGITLSGGQKQRTSISRAVIKNPQILVLDDSLSAVDTYTEDEILNRIRPIMDERTTIIVAHRISTIRDADHIIVLSEGKIAEQGTHEELLDVQGIYFDMYERQQLEENLQEIR